MSVVWGTCGSKEMLREKKSYDKLKTSISFQEDWILQLTRLVRSTLYLDLYRRVMSSYKENGSIPGYRTILVDGRGKEASADIGDQKCSERSKRVGVCAHEPRRVAIAPNLDKMSHPISGLGQVGSTREKLVNNMS